jgi:hypothetical protein
VLGSIEFASSGRNLQKPLMHTLSTVTDLEDLDVAMPKQLKEKMNGGGSKKNHTIW